MTMTLLLLARCLGRPEKGACQSGVIWKTFKKVARIWSSGRIPTYGQSPMGRRDNFHGRDNIFRGIIFFPMKNQRDNFRPAA